MNGDNVVFPGSSLNPAPEIAICLIHFYCLVCGNAESAIYHYQNQTNGRGISVLPQETYVQSLIVNGTKKPWRNEEDFVIMGMKYCLLNADSLEF